MFRDKERQKFNGDRGKRILGQNDLLDCSRILLCRFSAEISDSDGKELVSVWNLTFAERIE